MRFGFPRASSLTWTSITELGPLAVWVLVYPALLCLGHAALRTNAFDLSVFDYALWSTLSGPVGYVPFMGHSLFSHHVMPTLLALLPAYAVWPSPWLLILVQAGTVVSAWVLLRRVFRAMAVPGVAATVLLFAFLFSRRTHSAVMHPFYVESLEPTLTLWMIWAWLRGRQWQYWAALLLALGCKEDMALYIGAFGALLACTRGHRRLGLATAGVAAAWLVLSVLVVVPAIRQSEGLSPTYPFLADRYQANDDANAAEALARIFSTRSIGKVFNVTSSVGFLCFGAPGWFAVLLPGILTNLAARPDTMQSAFLGHYSWPFLSWLFVAGAVGLARVWRRSRTAGLTMAVLVCLITVVDSPLWRTRVPSASDLATAGSIRETLRRLPDKATVWVMPNLLPHIAHRSQAYTIGSRIHPAHADVLAVATIGSLWPLDDTQVARVARACRQDPRFARQPTVEALALFVLKDESSRLDQDGPCLESVRAVAGVPP